MSTNHGGLPNGPIITVLIHHPVQLCLVLQNTHASAGNSPCLRQYRRHQSPRRKKRWWSQSWGTQSQLSAENRQKCKWVFSHKILKWTFYIYVCEDSYDIFSTKSKIMELWNMKIEFENWNFKYIISSKKHRGNKTNELLFNYNVSHMDATKSSHLSCTCFCLLKISYWHLTGCGF